MESGEIGGGGETDGGGTEAVCLKRSAVKRRESPPPAAIRAQVLAVVVVVGIVPRVPKRLCRALRRHHGCGAIFFFQFHSSVSFTARL